MWEQQQARVNTSWMELNGRSRVFSLVLLYFRFFLLSFNIWFYYFIRYEWTKLGGMASTNTRIANIPNKTEIMFFKWIPTCAMIYIPIDCYCQEQQHTICRTCKRLHKNAKCTRRPTPMHNNIVLFIYFIFCFFFCMHMENACGAQWLFFCWDQKSLCTAHNMVQFNQEFWQIKLKTKNNV